MPRMILMAIRLCNPVFSIAIASKNPPMYRNTKGWPYADVVLPIDDTPSNGNKTIGSNDVTGSGTTSVTHHTEIHTVAAMTTTASRLIPSGCTPINKRKKSTGPAQKAMRCRKILSFLWAVELESVDIFISGLIYRALGRGHGAWGIFIHRRFVMMLAQQAKEERRGIGRRAQQDDEGVKSRAHRAWGIGHFYPPAFRNDACTASERRTQGDRTSGAARRRGGEKHRA